MNSNEKTNEEMHERLHGCGGRKRFWKFPVIFLAVILVKSAIAMLLWNELIPAIFHGPELTYLQVLGLLVLVKVFTGGPPRHFGGPPWGRHFRGHWAHLSDDERAKLRDAIRHRCGHHRDGQDQPPTT